MLVGLQICVEWMTQVWAGDASLHHPKREESRKQEREIGAFVQRRKRHKWRKRGKKNRQRE